MNKCVCCFSATGFPSHQQKVNRVIRKQGLRLQEKLESPSPPRRTKNYHQEALHLQNAYSRCGEFCARHGSNFYLGTFLLTPERRKAAWAIHAWGMRADEIVDGTNAEAINASLALENWQRRLERIFSGRPTDILDEALADTVSNFSLDIQPFRDVMDGMRMDVEKCRYMNFDELYLYCYNVSGTVSMMLIPILGVSQDLQRRIDLERICRWAVSLGVAVQLTNILRDVAEDAERGRIYLPQDELRAFDLCDEDVFQGKFTENWREFTKVQVSRARKYFDEAGKVVWELDRCSRWPVCSSLMIYKQILDAIEANGYDNLTTRAHVPKWKKLAALPVGLARTLSRLKR